MADKQISDLTSASAMTDGSLFVIEQGGAAKSANWGMVKNYISPGVAPQYSSSATYNVGDYAIYNGQLYRCITAITTPESWTAAHWTAAVLGDDVSENGMKFLGYVTSANYASVLADANNAVDNGFYILNFNWDTTAHTAHLPYSNFHGSLDLLITFKAFADLTTYIRQVYISADQVNSTARIYVRKGFVAGVNTSFEDWRDVSVPAANEAANEVKTLCESFLGTVTTNNYSTLLPDANNALTNGFYFLNFGFGTTTITAHLPYTTYKGRLDLLCVHADMTIGYYDQILYSFDAVDQHLDEWRRTGVYLGNGAYEWSDWILISSSRNNPRVVTVNKAGNADYTSLSKAMRENTGKCDFYVAPGTYNLIDELKALNGNDYFDDANFGDEGLAIQNNSRVFLDAKAIVTFNYEGDNTRVIELFSPFKFQGEGGELHGGQVICKNCRYAIHDDSYNADGTFPARDKRLTDGVYVYIRRDNGDPVAIGGGLGKSSHVELTNCYVDSGTTGYGVFYHNNSLHNDAQSFVIIKDCYFTSAIYIEPYGPSTSVSKALVNGNKAKLVDRITSFMTVDNFEMIAWNNETEQ